LAFGGPGCSSIGYGAVVEIGPLIVNKNGEGLLFNKYSWNQGCVFVWLLSLVASKYLFWTFSVLKSIKKGRD